MKTPAIFASNETLSSVTKPLKPSATASTQISFNHLYNKEISNKNALEATKKVEKNGSPKSEKIPNKAPDASNEVIPNEDNGTKGKESEMAVLPTSETNLGMISLLANANQFASNIVTPASSETQTRGVDVSIAGQNSPTDLGQQATEFDASKLAEKALQTSNVEFPHGAKSEIDGKIGDKASATLSTEDSKEVASAMEMSPVAKKSTTESKDAVANLTPEKKLTSLETTPEPVTSNMQNLAQAALLSNTPEALTNTKIALTPHVGANEWDKTLDQGAALQNSTQAALFNTTPEAITATKIALTPHVGANEWDKTLDQGAALQNSTQAALLSNTPEAITATKTALTPHVGANGWDKALGQKVVWMIAGGMQSAELSLNPPDLGPLQVVIKVSNDQASANFFSAQPEVREALESALPRLRQMLNEAGVQLSDFSVGSQASRQGNSFSDDRSNSARNAVVANSANGASAVSKLPVQVKTPARQGLIDTFA